MRGIQGLAIAGFLGLLGLTLNWVYLQQKTKDIKSVEFVGIRSGVIINPGEIIKAEHLTPVRIPEANARSLRDFVYLYENINNVVGNKATRRFSEGDLYYLTDYKTPAFELKLKSDERLIWIPVDSRSFVPSLVDPGDQITFILPADPASQTQSVLSNGAPPPSVPLGDVTAEMDFIGPFRVGSLGNRLSSMEVASANRTASAQARQVGIIVKVEGTKLEAKAMKLLDRLRETNYRNIGVALHPESK